jgi:hypothetical protein
MSTLREFKTYAGTTIVVPAETEEHLRARADVNKVLGEAIARLELDECCFTLAEVELGRLVGFSGATKTSRVKENEETTWMKRVGRDIYSRVVKATPMKVSTVVLIVANNDGVYNLITAYIGELSPREPTDRFFERGSANVELLHESVEHWRSYALIEDPDVFDLSTKIEATFEDIIKM